MTYLKPALALAAITALSACLPGQTTTTVTAPGAEPVVIVDGPEVAPAAPTATAGVAGADTLNGQWNLVASQCGDATSPGRLTVSGNRFTFPTSECTSTNSTVQTNYTSVSLGCSGGPNRQLNISIRPGVMRMTEDSTTLTYYRCQ